MTESEAIELIENDLKLHSKDLSGKYKNSLRMAINALEKQIPKKPYIQQVEIEDYDRDCMECPSCDSFLGYETDCKEEHYQDNYCPNCGQKLDWSELNNYNELK